MLAEGHVDGAVNTLVIANYFLASQMFQDKLQISSSIGTMPATFALATSRGATELSSILDKALLSIAPDELGVINSRWRGYTAASDSYWRNYHQLICPHHHWHRVAAADFPDLECLHAPPDQVTAKWPNAPSMTSSNSCAHWSMKPRTQFMYVIARACCRPATTATCRCSGSSAKT